MNYFEKIKSMDIEELASFLAIIRDVHPDDVFGKEKMLAFLQEEVGEYDGK